MIHKYGHFNEEGTEFIITKPDTPRAFDNFLWNDAVFSNVHQTGVGYCDYQVDDNEAIQLLTGNGRICDFDVFGRENLMSRLIYVRDNYTGEFWNVNWEPAKKPFEEFQCIHGLGYTIISTTVNGITAEFRIFIPKGNDPVELWTLKITNHSGRSQNISIFVYNQFQFRYKWDFDSYGDMIFRSCWFNRELNAVVASKHPHRKPHNYLTGFLTADELIAAYDGTRDAFVGLYNTLQEPKAVIDGYCTNTPGASDATIGAVQFNMGLEEGQYKEISMILGATDDERNIAEIRDKYFGDFDKYFNELREEKGRMASMTRISTPDEHLDRMMNYWLKQQTLYGATWCRWGWNGYRDIVQHGFGVSSFDPIRTRAILLKAFRYQYKNGLALRGWNPVDDKAYSDSALWLVFTLVSYLKETGDMELLEETVPYYDQGEATVLKHVEQALSFLEANKGVHGLCLIKFGDWNDSLTAVGKDGKGESVWLSEAYAQAALQMAELAEYLEDECKKKDYMGRYERIRKAINEAAWDGKWYNRCFDDRGQPVGSSTNEQGQIFIEAQAWALISGIAEKDRAQTLIESCDQLLLTDQGYMLLYPTFKKRDDNIGRISCLVPGVCENGTIYSHTNAWMILGFLKFGMPDKAYEIFKRITPGYVKDENDPKQKCPPYIYSNCYYGLEHPNNKQQMEFTWITGSVTWHYNVMLNEFLGVKPEYCGLRIDPCIPSNWAEYKVYRTFRDAEYHIVVKNLNGIQYGKTEIWVDGTRVDGNIIPIFSDRKVHQVEVLMRKD